MNTVLMNLITKRVMKKIKKRKRKKANAATYPVVKRSTNEDNQID